MYATVNGLKSSDVYKPKSSFLGLPMILFSPKSFNFELENIPIHRPSEPIEHTKGMFCLFTLVLGNKEKLHFTVHTAGSWISVLFPKLPFATIRFQRGKNVNARQFGTAKIRDISCSVYHLVVLV